MILFYHRVADDHPNPWTIPNDLFEKQIRWIQGRFEIVSLAEAQRRIKSGCNFRPTVSITFDDGYADNCSRALPFLMRHGIPCTYFVTLANIESRVAFPHDAQAGIPLEPNSLQEVRFLSDNGIEIGAHTRTHCDIGRVTDRRVLIDEIAVVKHDLERYLERPVRYFAIPYGMPWNISQAALEIAREAGYAGICLASGGYNLPDGDGFQLQRIHGDPEMLRLKNWLTFDRRKLPRHASGSRRSPVALDPASHDHEHAGC
jgi:peptidoglycan/xylan/chitin deacetylase (PgdA/CDA1 family)